MGVAQADPMALKARVRRFDRARPPLNGSILVIFEATKGKAL
jgi:hypothetical protein